VDPDKVISVLKVECGIDSSLASTVKEVGDERKWVTVLLRDSVESTIVDTKPEFSAFLPDEQDRSAASCLRRPDEAFRKVIVNIVFERFLFGSRKRIDMSERRCSSGV